MPSQSTAPPLPSSEILNLWLTNATNQTYLSRASRKYLPLITHLLSKPPPRPTHETPLEDIQATLVLLFHLSRTLFPGQQRKKIYDELDPLTLPLFTQTLSLYPNLLTTTSLPLSLSLLEIPFHDETLAAHIPAFNKLAHLVSFLEQRHGKESAQVKTAKEFWIHMEDRFDVLKRFQRFPWRNEMLGRESSFAEEEFMREWRAKGGGPRGIPGHMADENDIIVAEWKQKNFGN